MKRLLILLTITKTCVASDWSSDGLDRPTMQAAKFTYHLIMDQAQAALKPTFTVYQTDPNAHQIAHAAYLIGWQEGARAAQQTPAALAATRQIVNRKAAEPFPGISLTTRPWYQPTLRDCIIAGLTTAVIGTAIYWYAKQRK